MKDTAGSTAVRVLKSFVQTNFLSQGDQSLGFETLVPSLAEQFDDIVPRGLEVVCYGLSDNMPHRRRQSPSPGSTTGPLTS